MFSVSVTGTNSSLTAAAVVVTGLVGANFVQATLDKLRFRDPIARGIATASRYVHLLLINQSVLTNKFIWLSRHFPCVCFMHRF